MADIFLSYSRKDSDVAQRLASVLEARGWNVFWDRTIPAGKTWREVIGSALETARAVVVLWSPASVASNWVMEEAERGLARKALIPACIGGVQPPLGFGSIQAADLSAWAAGDNEAAIQSFLGDVARAMGAAPAEPPRRSAAPPRAAAPAPAPVPAAPMPARPGVPRAVWLVLPALLIALAGGWFGWERLSAAAAAERGKLQSAQRQADEATAALERAEQERRADAGAGNYQALVSQCRQEPSWKWDCVVPAVRRIDAFLPGQPCACVGRILRHNETGLYRCEQHAPGCGGVSFTRTLGYPPEMAWYTDVTPPR